MTYVNKDAYGFYINVITDGNNPGVTFDYIGLFGLT